VADARGVLQALESLDLSSNVFRGTIPASLSRLRRLNSLSLGVNVLYGTLPPELGELSLLERFDIDGGFNDQQMLVQAWYAHVFHLHFIPPLAAERKPAGQMEASLPLECAELPSVHAPPTSTLSVLFTAACVRCDRAKNSNYGTPGTSFGNQIAGTIPNSFTKLTKLHTWIMHRNMLTGERLHTNALPAYDATHLPSKAGMSILCVVTSCDLGRRVDSCR
jgi:hypothetical protein